MRSKSAWFIIGSICTILSAFAQECETIKAQIIDSKTSEPIPFAHVRIKDTSKGTISNVDGYFQLWHCDHEPIPLTISCMGYLPLATSLSLSSQAIVVKLDPDVLQLKEVTVVSKDYAKELVAKATAAIPQNYPDKSEILTGFMRENVSSDSLKKFPYYISEAEISVIKASYQTKNEEGIVKLEKGRKVISEAADSLSVKIYAGAHIPHRFDPIMARSGPFSKSDINDYLYDIVDTTLYDGKLVFKVNFVHRKKSGVNGTLWIMDDSYVVTAVRYFFDRKGVLDLREIISANDRQFLLYEADYFEQDGKWRLSRVNYETKFLDSRKRDVFLNSQYSTHYFTEEAVAIPYPERIQFNDFLLDVVGKYEPNYWEGFATITPSTDEQEYFQSVTPAEEKKSKTDKIVKLLSSVRWGNAIYQAPVSIGAHTLSYSRPEFVFDTSVASSDIIDRGFHTNFYFVVHPAWQVGLESWVSGRRGGTLQATRYVVQYRYNLNPAGRPIYLSPSVGFTTGNLAKKVGEVSSDATFRIDRKKFDAKEISVYSATQYLAFNPGLSLGIEKSRRLNYCIGIDYLMPLQVTNGIILRENQRPARRSEVFVQQPGANSPDWLQRDFQFRLGFIWGI